MSAFRRDRRGSASFAWAIAAAVVAMATAYALVQALGWLIRPR